MVELKYEVVNSGFFVELMKKIARTPTHGEKAKQIHKVFKELNFTQQKILKEYDEVISQKFGKRDAEGNVIRPEGQPYGFEPDEEKMSAFMEAQIEFQSRTVTLAITPFPTNFFDGFPSISAAELEILGGLYSGNAEAHSTGGATKLQSVS